MEPTEVCRLCERPDAARRLGLWFMNRDRCPVHVECWIAAYRAGRLPEYGTRLNA